jgi:hypothetical protein
MPKCIFCKSTVGPFNTREHILPEALGGEDWAILPDGLFCDTCQNVFGSSVEQKALSDYPFNQVRVLFAIPTKRGKAPWMRYSEGTITASRRPKTLLNEPSSTFRKPTKNGRKTQISITAEPLKPEMICRFLLKMALEVVASRDVNRVFEAKYDMARRFARFGRKSGNWWYLQRENLTAVDRRIKTGFNPPEWEDPVKLEVNIFDNGAEIFCLKFFYLEMFVPLESCITPPLSDFMKAPEYRMFTV